MNEKISVKPIYPDVIGAITGGPRVNMGEMEVALGIFPRQAFLNQPFEVILVMQNMVDHMLQVKMAIRLPTSDRQGETAVIETPKSQVSVNLNPGEVGVMRMPVIALLPTHANKNFPIRVAIRYRVKDAETAKPVRTPGGGIPPTILSVSPFKLQVLQDVEYAIHKWNESAEIMTVYFDLLPNALPPNTEAHKPRYETLWVPAVVQKETQLARKYAAEALKIAKSLEQGSSFVAFMDEIEYRFANREMPLHPGEIRAIAKMMAYTVDDAYKREPDFHIEETRWYRMLCQVLANDPELMKVERNELITRYTFEGVLYDSILLAFGILQSRVSEDLGKRPEQIDYANRVMTWFSGHGEADLSYVYLPLVLCGLVVSRWVGSTLIESPWDIIDELIEAYQGRSKLVSSGATDAVFDMLDELIEKQSRTLKLQRIERPRR